MAEQVWTLTNAFKGSISAGWEQPDRISNEAFSTELLAGAGPAYLGAFRIRVTDGAVELAVSSSVASAGGVLGPELSALFETSGQIVVTAGGQTVTIPGPNAPGSQTPDATEPYAWLPANLAEVTAFRDALEAGDDGTITIRDFIPTVAVRAQTGERRTGALSGSVSPRPQLIPPGTTSQSFTAEFENRITNLVPNSHNWGHHFPAYVALDSAFGEDRWFVHLSVFANGVVTLGIAPAVQADAQADLSGTFEAHGSIEVTVSGRTLYIHLANADPEEPYTWVPDNAPEIITFFNYLEDSTADASITLRDFEPTSKNTNLGQAQTGNLAATVQVRKQSSPVRAELGAHSLGAITGSVEALAVPTNKRVQVGEAALGSITGELSARVMAGTAARLQLAAVSMGALTGALEVETIAPVAVRAQLEAVALGLLSGTVSARTPPATPEQVDFGTLALGVIAGTLTARPEPDPYPPLSEEAMATKLQVYNMAISAARGRGTLRSLDQNLRSREECDKWYNLVLDVTQEAAYWPCCKARAELTDKQEEDSHDFAYSYRLPPGFLRPWYLHTFGRFSLESTGTETRIFADEDPATLYYAQRVTDLVRWDANLLHAIVYGLGYKISETLTGNDALVERLLGLANGYLEQAQSISVGYSTDGNLLDSDPEWISARGSALQAPTRFFYPFGEVWTNAS